MTTTGLDVPVAFNIKGSKTCLCKVCRKNFTDIATVGGLALAHSHKRVPGNINNIIVCLWFKSSAVFQLLKSTFYFAPTTRWSVAIQLQ